MSSLTDHFPELERQHPKRHDNSALRDRLAGAKVEDRPIVTELHRLMAERGAFATEPATR